MRKLLFFLLTFLPILTAVLNADEGDRGKEKEKIEVTAKDLESTKTTVIGKNGVVVYYQDSVIKADTAVYDKETQILVLDGKVELIGYMGSKEHSNHMEIDTQHNIVTFDQLYFVSKNDIWLISDKAKRKDGNFTLGNSIMSSCDADNPLWKMSFERSHYDSDEEYMKLYNTKIYFKDVPFAYTPYLAFSTNNERRSGLLFPLFGFSSREGFIYEQPIFWAIAANMDMEFNPQIRTNRSVGGYMTYRFVDSPYSSGEVRVGYFKDKEEYARDYGLPESRHYGLEFNYESSKVFSGYFPKDYVDGLYINTTFLNDIDYINLQKSTLNHFGEETPFQESRLNYFLYNNDFYTGINAKYYIDTSKVNNDETMQILPSIQLHKYLQALFIDNLTYSADLTFNNFNRKVGSTMQQAELNIPFEFTTSFFDDFLHLSLGESFYYTKSFFGNEAYVHDEFHYASNQHKAKLFSDLIKKYDGFIHVMQPSLSYRKPGFESQKPIDFKELQENQKELFTVGIPEEQYLLSLGQYFYDESMNLKFYQRISQSYNAERVKKLADLSNEMQYNWRTWTFYNNVVYSHEFREFREVSSRVSYRGKDYYVGVGQTYKEKLPDQTSVELANDVNFYFGYTYDQNIVFNGSLTYNLDEALSEQWRFGGTYKQDCWSMVASIQREITPRPGNTAATVDDTFYVLFSFIPFGSVGSN